MIRSGVVRGCGVPTGYKKINPVVLPFWVAYLLKFVSTLLIDYLMVNYGDTNRISRHVHSYFAALQGTITPGGL